MPSAEILPKIPPKRILVVDDELPVAMTIKMLLTMQCHTVELAENGEEALRLYELDKYDLVITDFALGKLTGLDLARHIKRQCPTQPIMMITAYGESLGFNQERLAYINVLVAKPFSLRELQAALAKIFSVQ